MKTDIADLYLYAVITGLFFFAAGVIAQSILVAVIGLIIIVGLLGIIIVFAMKDFGWFEKPAVVYVDRPVSVPQVMTGEVMHHYPSEPRMVYQEEYEEPDEYEEDAEDKDGYEDPFDDLDPLDNWGFLD